MFEISEETFREHYKLQKFADKSIEKFNLKFPIKPNSDIVKIMSFLTFDGHLSLTNKLIVFSAGSESKLEDIIRTTENQFAIKGKTRKVKTNAWGTSFEHIVCCEPIGKILESLGTPKGDKVLKQFDVPTWIRDSRKFSFQYLKTAFECEGTIWREKKRIRASFKINKSSRQVENGIKFLNTMRSMLRREGVATTEIWTTKSNIRMDGNITYGIQFRIKDSDTLKFIKRFDLKNKARGLNDMGQTSGLHDVIVQPGSTSRSR